MVLASQTHAHQRFPRHPAAAHGLRTVTARRLAKPVWLIAQDLLSPRALTGSGAV